MTWLLPFAIGWALGFCGGLFVLFLYAMGQEAQRRKNAVQ